MTLDGEAESLQTAFGGRYVLDRELGRGGMATVYLARDAKHDRLVAIKVLRADLEASSGPNRFLTEIRVAANLQHPHIVGLIDSGDFANAAAAGGSRPYYVMPYVQGETLRDRLSREGALPIATSVEFLREVADALDCAHLAGIVHRDIKPENILLSQRHAMVADFGVAKALMSSGYRSTTTTVGLTVGTVAYMAPEQALADPTVDHRVDLYSLGVMAHEMLAGHPPFTGATLQAVVTGHLTKSPPALRAARSDCPLELQDLVLQLLAKDPAERPQTASEVRDRLAVIGASVSAESVGARPEPPKTTKRIGVLVAAALGVVMLATAGIALIARGRTPGGIVQAGGPTVARSLAVLPVKTSGSDSATDYFSDGIAEELITALGRLPGLRVTPRTSAFAFADRTQPGRKLGVTNVLEVSVRRAGQRVRVTVRLLDVARDRLLWTNEYNGNLLDVFAVQDSIARAVVGELRLTLADSAGGRLVARPTTTTAAYDFYLRGRTLLAHRNPGSLDSAIEAFRGALLVDSTFAAAHAGLADAYSLEATFGQRRPHDMFPLAKLSARRALTLDPTLSEAHTSLGMVSMFYDWNWSEAEQHLRRGVELNPSSAEARLFYAWYLLISHQPLQTQAQLDTAFKLDPFSVILATRRGTLAFWQGKNGEAVPLLRRALEINPAFPGARSELADALAQSGGDSNEVMRLIPTDVSSSDECLTAWTLVRLNKRKQAIQWVERVDKLAASRYVPGDCLAEARAALGDTAGALAALETAERDHAFTLVFLAVRPTFASVRGSDRFRQIESRMGIRP